MTKQKWAALLAATLFLSGTAIAQDDGATPEFSPVELYACNYNEGMGPGDLDKAVESWNEWMDDEGQGTYYAATLFPVYYGGEGYDFDFAWLGSFSNGAEMGAGSDHWMANGSEHAAAFAAVADCFGHVGYAATQIKETEGDNTADSFVVTFSDCHYGDGDGSLFDALKAWSEFATGRGYQNRAWALFQTYGGVDPDHDFKMVNSYKNFTAMGDDWDLYASGDWVKNRELRADIYECGVSRVYAGKTLRRPADD
jgi:hypothetical protein